MGREYVGMRLNSEIIKAIDTLAKEQYRNRSNAIEWILAEWLKEHRPELVQFEKNT
ncbi:MAG: ribbon-helix-helix domain-containing protein [Treponema sp.]|nr:ribbon-helix-helix domain-containing protein [Treponema sp.]